MVLEPIVRKLAAARPEQMIRIGCEHGSGFIYIGQADSVDYDYLNAMVRKKLPKNAPNKYKVETRKKWEEAIANYEPLQSREVIDQFRSEVEDHIIIIVEGFGGFIQYKPEAPGSADFDNHAMIDLVGAVYKESCRELIHAYKTGKREDIERCERWIRKSPYGFLTDPEGIIKACREANGRKIIKKHGAK